MLNQSILTAIFEELYRAQDLHLLLQAGDIVDTIVEVQIKDFDTILYKEASVMHINAHVKTKIALPSNFNDVLEILSQEEFSILEKSNRVKRNLRNKV